MNEIPNQRDSDPPASRPDADPPEDVASASGVFEPSTPTAIQATESTAVKETDAPRLTPAPMPSLIDPWKPVGRRFFGICTLIVVPISIVSMFYWDMPIARAVMAMPSDDRQWARDYTNIANGGYVIATFVVLSLMFYVAKRPVATFNMLVGAVAAATTGIAVNVLKVLFGRYRPKMLFRDGLYGFAPLSIGYGANSFPSGHSTTAGVIAGVLIILSPRLWFLWLPIGGFIAAMRVFTTSHYPSDVLCGLLLGIFGTMVCYSIAQRSRFWPGAKTIATD